MIEILSLIDSFAQHIVSDGELQNCITLVENLIALAETLKTTAAAHPAPESNARVQS